MDNKEGPQYRLLLVQTEFEIDDFTERGIVSVDYLFISLFHVFYRASFAPFVIIRDHLLVVTIVGQIHGDLRLASLFG